MKRKKGMTVVEVLAVVVILLLVTITSLPFVWHKIEQANEVAALASLKNIESIYRMTKALSLLDADPHRLPLVHEAVDVHIPLRKTDAESKYAEEMQQEIAIAFGEELPVYEITESVSSAGAEYTIAYWPDADKTPQKCYLLQNNEMHKISQIKAEEKS